MMENLIETFRGEVRKIVADELAKQLDKLNQEKQEPKNERLLTTEEACKFLRCSKPTLHRWKKEGLVPHLRIGANIRYRESDLKKISN